MHWKRLQRIVWSIQRHRYTTNVTSISNDKINDLAEYRKVFTTTFL